MLKNERYLCFTFISNLHPPKLSPFLRRKSRWNVIIAMYSKMEKRGTQGYMCGTVAATDEFNYPKLLTQSSIPRKLIFWLYLGLQVLEI